MRVNALIAPLLFTATLAACDAPPAVYVDQAYVRLSPNPDSPSAGYFTIHAGDAPVTLRDVMTDSAVKVEMHNSVMKDGVMKMEPLDSVDVPAKATVRFSPGGRHLMLWNVNPQAVAAGKITFTMLFSNGDRILVDAPVQKPVDASQEGADKP